MPTRTWCAPGLEAVVEPQLLPLLRVIGALAAQMHQAVQHHVLAHAVRQVVVDDAHHRHGRQLRVAHEMVDPGAEREQHLQVRQGREAPRRVLPGGDVPDFGRVERLAQGDDGAFRHQAPEALDPGLGLPLRDRDEEAHAMRSTTTGRGETGSSPSR